MSDTYLIRKINILPGNIIIVPGTEPSTSVTSTSLEVEIRKAGREVPAIIELKTALALIPGSKVEILLNYDAPSQKFFLLPPENISDCDHRAPDYYEILRTGSRPANPEEKQVIAACGNIDDYSKLFGS